MFSNNVKRKMRETLEQNLKEQKKKTDKFRSELRVARYQAHLAETKWAEAKRDEDDMQAAIEALKHMKTTPSTPLSKYREDSKEIPDEPE